MSRPALLRALEHARATAGQPAPLADDQLLTRFVADRDEDAFAELVRRHGPLVRGVARRQLADAHKADDVLQGTFLALARQAGRVGGRPLAPWLFTVANRLACKARVRAARRPGPTQNDIAIIADPLATLTARELVTALDDELARLPERYRLPLVLCGLDGLTRDEAAARLGWTLRALRGRLERGRELLRKRLTARGLTVPTVLAGGLLAAPAEAMPAALVRAVVRAAVAAPPLASSVKPVVVAALMLTMLGVGTGVVLLPGGQQTPKVKPPASIDTGTAAPQPRVDAEGIPLPREALARFGSSRMRHAGPVYEVAISPSGGTVMSAAQEDGIRFWDMESGKLLVRLDSHDRPLGFTADGQQFLNLAVDPPGCLRAVDPATGREISRAMLRAGQRANSVALSPSGRFAAISWNDDRSVRVYDTATGRETVRFHYTGKSVYYGLVFSSDERTLGVADQRDTVALYDVTTGRLTGELRSPGQKLLLFGISTDGRSAVTTTRDQPCELQIWDLPGRVVRHRINLPTLTVAAFSPDSRLLITGRPSAVWDVATGREMRQFPDYFGGSAIAFSADNKTVSIGSQTGTVALWDLDTGKRKSFSAEPATGTQQLHFVPAGRPIAWSLATGREVPRFPETPTANDNLALSSDGRLIAAFSERIRLIETSSGRELREFGRQKPSWSLMLFTPDNRRLIFGCADGVHVYDLGTGAEILKLSGITGDCYALATSRDGRWIGAADQTGTGLWDSSNGRLLRRFQSRVQRTADLAFSPNGDFLAEICLSPEAPTSTSDVVIWEMMTGRKIRTCKVGVGCRFNCLAFAPDGRTLAIGGARGTIRLWEVAAGAERHQFTGHTGYVHSLVFAPDGRTLAASSPDAPVYLWDVYGRSDRQRPATADELNQCWADFAGSDAAAAFQAIRRLIAAPDGVAFLRDRLKPVIAADAVEIKQWVAELDSPTSADRGSAAKELDAIADRAADQLRTALAKAKSAEVRQSLQAILARMDTPTPDVLRALRAVEVLEQIATPAARKLLTALSSGATGATLTRAASDALKRLGP